MATRCYNQGRKAFFDGSEECTYPSDGSGRRMAWYDGYLDARMEERLANLPTQEEATT